MTSCVNINTAQLSAAPADDLVDFFNTEKKKRASNLQQEEKELLVELVVTKYHNITECKATDVASVKMKRRVGDAGEGIPQHRKITRRSRLAAYSRYFLCG